MYQQYVNQAQGSLSGLSSDELKELLNDDVKLEDIVTSVLGRFESEKQTILDANSSLAEDNLTKEPELAEHRNRINELSAQGKELCIRVQELLNQSKTQSNTMNQDTALALLQTAAAESEEQSDAFVKQFLDKELAVDAFLDLFLTTRKAMHLRKVKAEKMAELARQQRQSVSGGTPNNRPYSGFYPSGSPSMVPYPTGGSHVPYPMSPNMNMPMPGQFNANHFSRP